MISIHLMVNNQEYHVEVEEDLRLIDLLREKLMLTGTKEGCGEGECGACTIIMDGKTVNSCLVMAFQADGSRITTIEGISKDGELHPIQQAFLDVGAVQCGFCTPGMVLSAKALLDESQDPDRQQIREGISGNLCRCTGYNKIIDAIVLASSYIKEGQKDETSSSGRA
ncbi:carbon-monoxide dehydrogenase small subunit [Anaerosolibacter carboniphilus]|uniref:Carbon-monoxide dehydrogenase small subunit n=1 Tax=Anaerosolibacter carboniphilus TaxID=1417629 RepID=A0A841KSL9_9FIRM|nr:(2Fe-2S)-binding protein [Anaerosolibacter carboniphilus]MBB6215138.1 carbon-monoxide dehydrogenase small subunit [Anaerosolibacter carboniphilus]